jgi:formylglycine-generating enzyme required for sulfatase activity
MSLTVKCPHPDCGRPSTLAEGSVGRAVLCPHCRRQFFASSTASPPPAADAQTSAEVPIPTGGLPRQIGRFLVRARLGEGAFGTVYRAYDPQLDRDVALKVPLPGRFEGPQQAERFLREARAAARLRHPHVVPLFEASEQAPHFYLASALIQGRTLAAALDEGPFDFREAARVARELAEALAYAHGEGVVHRDVKPANVMLDEKGAALLLDFGLAHRQGGEKRLTGEGAVVGTPAYIAPEQLAAGSAEVSAASDQYSLGVVLYELLCGRAPFEGPTEVVLFNALHSEPPPPRSFNPAVPPALEAICLKALAKRPQDRHADCQEMAGHLRRWLDGQSPTDPHLPAASPGAPPAAEVGGLRRRSRWAVAAVAAVLATALAAAVVASFRARTDGPRQHASADSERPPEQTPTKTPDRIDKPQPPADKAQRTRQEQVAVTGLSGTFTLTFDGLTTRAMGFNASAATVERALHDLPGIGGAGVSVSQTDFAEVQQFTVKQKAGVFRLTFKNHVTGSLAIDATADKVQDALNALPSIGGAGGNVTVSQAGSTYTVTFGAGLGSGQQPLLMLSEQLPVTVTGARSITTEVQQFTIKQKTGHFRLTFDGKSTPLLPAAATADEVQATLNALPSIGKAGGSVKVSQVGSTYTVTFQRLHGGQPQLLRVTGTGSVPVTRRDGAAVQQLTAPLRGGFRLTFKGSSTPLLPVDATADKVQEALNALPSIGKAGGHVTVTQVGRTYTVTFGGTLASGRQPSLTVTPSAPIATQTPASEIVRGYVLYVVTFREGLGRGEQPLLSGTGSGGASVTSVQKAPEDKDKAPKEEIVKGQDPFTNSLGMKFVRVKAGTFTMGSPKNEKDRNNDEDQHEVTISQDYFLGTTEVTQKQFRDVMGFNPSAFSKTGNDRARVQGMDTDDFPVENVSWEEVQEFLKKLNALAAEKKNKVRYRLPTEAEWEYACRGGHKIEQRGEKAQLPFHLKSPSKSLGHGQANFYSGHPSGGGKAGPSLDRTCPVAQYEPNVLGLYDMHGNVHEWCEDWYASDYYAKSPAKDPLGPDPGPDRVSRGGGWPHGGRHCRAAIRVKVPASIRQRSLGFRVAAVPHE